MLSLLEDEPMQIVLTSKHMLNTKFEINCCIEITIEIVHECTSAKLYF